MKYVWTDIDKKTISESARFEDKKEYAMKNLYGIEKDDFLAKVSKAYMAILGDGRSNVYIEDSLSPEEWSHRAKGSIHDEKFDYVLTNPPFGKDVKVKEETKRRFFFDSVDLIFLERSLQLLHDGGILGIVLPETIFHSPTNKVVRDKIFENHNVMALVDIPHDTFRPYNNAKCDIIFIQKNTKQQENVLTIKVDNIGHNHNGDTVYKYDLITDTFDKSAIDDDIPEIIENINDEIYMEYKKQGIENDYTESKPQNDKIKYVPFNKVINDDILVARYYFTPEIDSDDTVSLGQLIEEGVITSFDGHGSPRSHLKGMGEYPYVRVKDIVNLEVYINPQDKIPEFEYERLFRENKRLKEKDIVFVRRGSYRIGDVGILYPKDLKSILTREILILRVNTDNKYSLTPHNFLYLLNTNEFRKQFSAKIMMDTTLPNIADRWKELYLPLYDEKTMEKLDEEMEILYNSRAKFWAEMDNIDQTLREIRNEVK